MILEGRVYMISLCGIFLGPAIIIHGFASFDTLQLLNYLNFDLLGPGEDSRAQG